MNGCPAVAAAIAGLAAALAFPAPGYVPLVFVAWAPLLVVLERATVAQGFGRGAVAGLVFFAVVLRWLAPLSALAWLVVSAYLALCIAVFGAIAARLLGGPGAARLALPAAWVALEWLRGWLVGGFNWAALGSALTPVPELLPLARTGGVAALSFAILVSNQSVAAAAVAVRRGARLEAARAAALAVAVPVAMLLHAAGTVPAPGEPAGLAVALIDGDTDPRADGGNDFARAIQAYVARTDRALAGGRVDLVLWPETALPRPLDEGGLAVHARALRRRIAHRWQAPLLFGVPVAADVGGRYWNEAQLWWPDGVARYQKRRPVPFGEYALELPLIGRLPRVLSGPEIAAGAGGAPFVVAGMRLGVLICFEDLFSADALERAAGADALVVLTNDAWLGDAGAAQHLAAAVLRAVESGRWVARAANRGASVTIDPWGRTTPASLAPARLPAAAGGTPYAEAPALVPMASAAATLAALVAVRSTAGLRRRSARPPPGCVSRG